MKKKRVNKSYLLGLTSDEWAFIEEIAWRMRLRPSEYLRGLVEKEMSQHPQITESALKKASGG